MDQLFASGRIIDLLLILVIGEFVIFVLYQRINQRGIGISGITANLISGAFLLVAVRLALVQAWWAWIACCLLISFLAHILDMTQRTKISLLDLNRQ